MKMFFLSLALAALAAVPASAAAVTGRWANPKRSVIIEVAPCAAAYCGTVVWASDKAKANARKGGTANLIGTRLIEDARPNGNGSFKGRGFVPKQNIHAPATIRFAGPDTMIVKGCVIGIICKEQRWTRVK